MKIYTLKEILEKNMNVYNEMITSMDICLIGHFENVVTLEINLNHNRKIFSEYTMTLYLGKTLQFFFEFLGTEKEDGARLREIRNVPIRIVLKKDKVMGMGHFMGDRFILFEELIANISKKEEN